jgi:hypothetical protein
MTSFSLTEIRNGTWGRRARFVLVDPEAPVPEGEEALRALLRETLDTLSEMTSDNFACGADRPLRRKIAVTLGLDPGDFSL